jgi:hypothetical protein
MISRRSNSQGSEFSSATAQAYAARVVAIVYLRNENSERELTGHDVTTISVPTTSAHPIAAQLCAEIHRHNFNEPMVFVAEEDVAHFLPSVAFAQRTAHRSVAGYVLVNPDLGPPHLDWPDAPVLVLGDTPTAERDAHLRGWQFEDLNEYWQVRVQTFASDVTPI